MADDSSIRVEIEHMKNDIAEIKADAKEKNKENTKEMMDMRDSKIRTEIKLEEIQKSQKLSDDNQTLMMQGIQDIKDKPFLAWSKMSTAWKIATGVAVIGFIVTYALGSYFGYIKMMGIWK